MIGNASGLELDATTLHDIGAAVGFAYREVARRAFYSLSEVHYKPVCLSASMVIAKTMTVRGYPVQEDEAVTFTTGEANNLGIYHAYCVLGDTEKPEAVIDATWQQFLSADQRTEDVPKILIGTREDARKVAESTGLTEPAILDLWLPPSARQERYGRGLTTG